MGEKRIIDSRSFKKRLKKQTKKKIIMERIIEQSYGSSNQKKSLNFKREKKEKNEFQMEK